MRRCTMRVVIASFPMRTSTLSGALEPLLLWEVAVFFFGVAFVVAAFAMGTAAESSASHTIPARVRRARLRITPAPPKRGPSRRPPA